MIGMGFSLFMLMLVGYILLRITKKIWYKMHDIAGIDPRPVSYQQGHLIAHHPNQPLPTSNLSGYGQNFLQNAELTEQFQAINKPSPTQNSLSKYWHLKYGKVTPLTYLPSITAEKIHEVPSEALVVLDRINDKMARYTVWRAELNDVNEAWLTEKQYAINRLINESVPEAVNHYDQLARFDPHRVQHTKINGDMTASDILIDVLQEVDNQLDSLIDELYQQTVHKLASMHRYVKTRVQ